MRLQDKVAIITGAGGGMGRVAAQLFANEGAKVVVAEFGEAAGCETVAQVEASGGQATYVRTDVSDEASAKAMVDHAIATYGRVDVLYNNAGVMPEADHSVIDTDVATWDQVMAVNVGASSSAASTRSEDGRAGLGLGHQHRELRGAPRLQRPPGRVHGVEGRDHQPDPEPRGPVRPQRRPINAICPAPVEPPLLIDWLVKDEEAKRIRLARNPTGRFGKPEEIVNMAVYLASDESRWTNGASLVVDGGISVNYF